MFSRGRCSAFGGTVRFGALAGAWGPTAHTSPLR